MNPRWILIGLLLVVVLLLQWRQVSRIWNESYGSTAPCKSLGVLLNRRAQQMIPPLLEFDSDRTLTNVAIDVKDILPVNVIPFLKTGDTSGPSKGELLKMSISTFNVKATLDGITNVMFESADADYVVFSCIAKISVTLKLLVDNIRLLGCALSSFRARPDADVDAEASNPIASAIANIGKFFTSFLKLPTTAPSVENLANCLLSIDLKIVMKVKKVDFQKSEVEVNVASITSNFQKSITKWVNEQLSFDTSYRPTCSIQDCNAAPACTGWDEPCDWICPVSACTSCGCGWKNKCELANKACEVMKTGGEAVWKISDCGLANQVLSVSDVSSVIHSQILAKVGDLMAQFHLSTVLRDQLVNSPDVVSFYREFLQKGMSRCGE